MTLNGTVNKTGILLLCAVATAAWTWNSFLQSHDLTRCRPLRSRSAPSAASSSPWSPSSRRNGRRSPRPSTALLEGLVLGGLSAIFELRYPGIAMEAVGLTFGTLFVLLFALQVRPHQGHAEVSRLAWSRPPAASALLLLQMLLGFFAHPVLHSVNGSGPHRHRLQPVRGRHRRAQPGARLRLRRAGRHATALPSTWNGTAHSASWSRWSGSTLRSCACSPRCAAATKERLSAVSFQLLARAVQRRAVDRRS